jgi:predicted transcriptional regulator
VVCPDSGDPHAPVQRLIQWTQDVDELQVLVPAISPFYVDMFTRRVEASPSFDIVTTPDAIEAVEAAYPDGVESFLGGDGRTVSLDTGLPGFGVCLHDEGALVLTFTDDQRVHAVLEVTEQQPALVEWAADVYDDHSADSEVYDG